MIDDPFRARCCDFCDYFFSLKKKAALYCTRTMPVLIDCDLGGVCPHRYPSLFREAAARGIEISHWVIGEKGGREEDVRLADLHTSPLPPPPQMVQWVSPELLSSSLAEYRDMPETDESGEV